MLFDPQKVFLASDCIGVFGWNDVPGYAMVADGTYQDTHCDSVAWSYGLFPNWRNTLWSCNWADITGFHLTRWGVRTFGVPVAISNGWGDDCGPSEWSPRQRDAFLRLFRERLKMKQPCALPLGRSRQAGVPRSRPSGPGRCHSRACAGRSQLGLGRQRKPRHGFLAGRVRQRRLARLRRD